MESRRRVWSFSRGWIVASGFEGGRLVLKSYATICRFALQVVHAIVVNASTRPMLEKFGPVIHKKTAQPKIR